MRVLLLGGGGREHAIGWKLAQSEQLSELRSMPGNPGLAELGPTVDADPADPPTVVSVATSTGADLVVVGPEAPLAAGVVDALDEAGIAAFGPTRAAAQLESSKSFAKEIMRRAGVPTAASATFDDPAAAVRHLEQAAGPYVVKADGLAAGKGVLVTGNRDEAEDWVHRCLGGGFGSAGATVIIEEHLSGREVSVFAVCDGATALPLAPARDYKRLGDGDEGPNTGGMGAFSPVGDLPADLVEWTMQHVIHPTLDTLSEAGSPYRGFLYAGLMLTPDGPQVLEFNCRLGDPETQVVLPRLEDDLLPLLADAANGSVGATSLAWSPQAALNVVLASAGYPHAPTTGVRITGHDAAAETGAILFHAGTGHRGAELVTTGGRVLNVVGRGDTLQEAQRRAYDAAELVDFPGKTYRTDIGNVPNPTHNGGLNE